MQDMSVQDRLRNIGYTSEMNKARLNARRALEGHGSEQTPSEEPNGSQQPGSEWRRYATEVFRNAMDEVLGDEFHRR